MNPYGAGKYGRFGTEPGDLIGQKAPQGKLHPRSGPKPVDWNAYGTCGWCDRTQGHPCVTLYHRFGTIIYNYRNGTPRRQPHKERPKVK